MTIVKKQHFVPMFYLRNFTSNDNEQLFVLDKENNKIFVRNIMEICEQKYFYSFSEDDEYNFLLEEHLGKKEDKFSCVINKVINDIEGYYFIKNKSIEKLAHDDKKTIIEFILYQIIRVPKYINKLFSMVIPQFKQFNIDNGIEQTDKQIINDIKKYSFPNYFDRINEMVSILLKKNWTFFIISNNINNKFVSSDNPVLISNSDFKSPIRGALIDPMTEISIPLSKNIALALKKDTIKYRLNYILINSEDNVDYINKLLLRNGMRFVYSANKSLLE